MSHLKTMFWFLICLLYIEAKTKGQQAKAGSRTMDAMKESMGALIKTPMTRTEACQILNIEESGADGEEAQNEPIDHKLIMERFDILFEKNSAEKGGSFYIRSKIFFAKEHLM